MINTELLLAAWLEKLQKKWDTEEYYYDVEEDGTLKAEEVYGKIDAVNKRLLLELEQYRAIEEEDNIILTMMQDIEEGKEDLIKMSSV